MAEFPEYFIGTGDVHFSPLDADGEPTKWFGVKEVPMVEFNGKVDFADNFSTGKAGPNLQDLHVAIKRTATLALQLKERLPENLEFMLHGESSSENAGNVNVAFDLPAGIADGDKIMLPGDHVGITNLVLHDSAVVEAVLDADNYSFDGDSRLITFISVAGLTQPIQVISYAYKASKTTKLMSKTPPDVAVLFDGINLAKPGQKVRAFFKRVTFDAAAKFALKSGGDQGTATTADSNDLTGVVQLKPGDDQSDGYGTYQTY